MENNKKAIYIASPYYYHGNWITQRFHHYIRYQIVMRVTAKLMKQGMVVFSPIVHGHAMALKHDLPKKWEYWKDTLEVLLPRFDELWVVLIEGWDRSRGVKAEIELAQKLGIKVRYITPDLMKFVNICS